MYSLPAYGAMIADRARIRAYAEAMRKAIRPGDIVLEIGTGTGIMAILAAQLGAKRVYAIESCEIIQVAREIAAANHCADQIEFVEDFSTNVSSPLLADVIVSDLRGALPLFGRNIPSVVDARRRFLAPGGTLIARKDSIWAAVVEAPQDYAKIRDPWDRNSLGQDLTIARRKVLNELHKARLKQEQLLTVPALWATVDYATVESPDVHAAVNWKVERAGTGHGILLWFDSELAEGVTVSNAPSPLETVWGATFFPWLEPVSLAEGQTICADIEAKLLETDYFWRWTTQIESEERPGETAARFEQSELQGAVLSLAKLHKSAADFIPHLSPEGVARKRTLEMMDGTASLEEIARQLAAEFPEQFTRWQQALSFAASVSKEFSK